MKPAWVVVVFALTIVALSAVPAAAQPVISAKSGLVSYTEGKVTMGDQPIESSATSFPDVKENAVLRTEEGRAEVLLTMGVMLRMGEQSSMKMLTTRLIDTRMELLGGSHIVEADEIQKDNNLTIQAKDSTVLVNKRGLYRFDLDQNRLKVFDGIASVQKNGQTILVNAGKMLALDGASSTVEKFDKDNTDALDRWSKRRAELNAMANPSSAKQVRDYGCAGSSFANPVGTAGSPCYNPCGGWRWNPWYGMVTYIPCGGGIYSPYGYRFYSPYNVMRAYYTPPPPSYNRGGYGGGGGAGFGGYTGMSQTSGGYSGAMSAPSSSVGVSSPSAASASGTTSSGSAGAASAGHGGGGGGHGR
ncbi:MAG TPA: hypothetical protein VMH28_25735 [Candidatus Acidoferrales bacterium]|nr:hypothetical protein [Candidatus Acidoferrales bacterium]